MGAFDLFRAVVNGGGFSPLLTWGETTLGAVTGNNAYFTMTAEEAATHKIPKRDLRPISPPGSRHLRGLTFSQRDWAELAEEGAACFLFSPDSAKPSAAALRYIQDGDAQGVNETYKCRNRTPWWRVPLVRVPDVLLTYMDHERPRLVTNEARVLHLNSIYGVTLRHGLRELGRDLLPIATLNSVTLLAAEMVGRAYGGGLLKLEPSEADRWLVPSEKIVRAAHAELRRLHPKISTAVKANKVAAAVELVDQVLLTSHLGFTTAQITQLRDGRAALFSRRNSRSRGGRAEDDAPHLPSKPIENRLKD
jgi:hypothetical protein